MKASRFIPLEPVPLHTVDYGGDGPPLLCVHGLGGSHTNWNALAPLLTSDFEVLATDLPGFGLSPPVVRHDLESHVTAVVSAIRRLFNRPVVLVGNSMGGLVIQLVAAQHPGLVASLVMIAPAAPLPPGTSPPDRTVYARLALQSLPIVGQAALWALEARLSPERLVGLTLDIVAAHPSWISPDVRRSIIEMARRRRSMPWARRAFAESAASVRRLLSERDRYWSMIDGIETPGIVIFGAEDRVVSPASGEALASRNAGFELILLDGVGHVPQLEVPATVSELIRRVSSSESNPAVG